MAPKTTASKGKGKKAASSSGEAVALPVFSVLHSSALIPPHGDIGSDNTQTRIEYPHYPMLENLLVFHDQSQEEFHILFEPSSATLRRLITDASLETADQSRIPKPNFLFGDPTEDPDVLDFREYRWFRTPFKRYVEIGRVALVNYGKDYGRLVVIVDVLDQNRALVDAPDMVRGQMNFKRLTLTDIKIDIPRIPKKKSLIAAMEAADVKNKWENSSWGRKLIVQKRRASLNDFDRFKVMLAKIKRGAAVRQELGKLKKQTAA
ncbi:uncharacterized protein A4U43_UnF9290 [Asparagus officinalis]|uniref:Large ribosomal subunit protein eL14 domain-containing protein n=1 Tax=Asparagus officinalis TaxID=4686 RepID=A0A1R3L5S5_ASPOF|nr:uncharacterized protein A4U43_UnF9290 [Asparagus officinalis]